MPKKIYFFFALIFVLCACTSERKFQIVTGDSAKLLSDDRLIMVNYWAVWCIPCLEEMPELAEFREANHEDVEVYAVNYDNPSFEELENQIKELGVEIPALVEDPQTFLGYERPLVLPATYVLRKGELLETLVGPQTQETLEVVLEKWKG